ncbi:MAG: hypothetical protein AAFU58_00140 [Pseudomonadota bacterium]
MPSPVTPDFALHTPRPRPGLTLVHPERMEPALFPGLPRNRPRPISRVFGPLPREFEPEAPVSDFKRADAGVLQPHAQSRYGQSLRFDLTVDADGYAWWYVDALSDDGHYGLTMIAFIGSVFSPYYAFSGRHQPTNHCALNVALYGRKHGRWTMTERGHHDLRRGPDFFKVGPSMLTWDGQTLIAHIDEYTAPIPRRVRGTIKVTTPQLGDGVFLIDPAGRHRWRPLAPHAHVEVDFSEPGLTWTGHGYFDSNDGDEPLEAAFNYWDWSRTTLEDGRTAILYNTDLHSGAARHAALLVGKDATITPFEPPATHRLAPTPWFRISRRTRTDNPAQTRVIKTFEDTPFYSRSLIETKLFGKVRRGVHESLSGNALKRLSTKIMLPFRMPRRPGPTR